MPRIELDAVLREELEGIIGGVFADRKTKEECKVEKRKKETAEEYGITKLEIIVKSNLQEVSNEVDGAIIIMNNKDGDISIGAVGQYSSADLMDGILGIVDLAIDNAPAPEFATAFLKHLGMKIMLKTMSIGDEEDAD